MTAAAPPGRPLIAVLSEPLGLSPMALAPLAAERYNFLWIVDPSTPAPKHQAAVHGAMVRKLGTVVSVRGLSVPEAAAAIAQHQPDGVVTFQDGDMVRLAEIATKLGLPFHTPAIARRLVDKSVQRAALKRRGVPVPRHLEVPSELGAGAIARLPEHLDFPAVLKPRSGAGSKCVTLVQTPDELVEAMAQRQRDGLSDPMLVEEFIPAADRGDGQFAALVSVESYVSQSHISHVALTGRFPFAAPFRETGNFIPADLSDSEQRAVCTLASESIRALGVEGGCLHTEIKLTPDGPRLIEVNGRLGGGIPQMLGRVTNLDLFDVACRIALGERLPGETIRHTSRIAYRSVLQPPMSASRIVRVDGLEQAAKLPGVDVITPNKGAGQLVDWREGFAEFVFSAEGTVADYDALRQLSRRLRQEVAVIYE